MEIKKNSVPKIFSPDIFVLAMCEIFKLLWATIRDFKYEPSHAIYSQREALCEKNFS